MNNQHISVVSNVTSSIPEERIDKATDVVRDMIQKYGSGNKASTHLGLNTSVHISKLLNERYLSPTLEQSLISSGAIEYRQRYHLVESCAKCGDVHVRKTCNGGKKRKRNRVSINAEDAKSAAASIVRIAGEGFSVELAEEIARMLMSKGESNEVKG